MKEETARKTVVPWVRSERFERKMNFTVNGTPDRVFPLLCPIREYEWLPGWSCRMVHSATGVAEKNAVFHTTEILGRTAVWTTVTYDPNGFIEYLIVSGKAAVIRLSIRLSGITGQQPGIESRKPASTNVEWTMLFTVKRGFFARVLGREFSEAKFKSMMDHRERELNRFLETGEMIGS
jgi:hypothetical protein